MPRTCKTGFSPIRIEITTRDCKLPIYPTARRFDRHWWLVVVVFSIVPDFRENRIQFISLSQAAFRSRTLIKTIQRMTRSIESIPIIRMPLFFFFLWKYSHFFIIRTMTLRLLFLFPLCRPSVTDLASIRKSSIWINNASQESMTLRVITFMYMNVWLYNMHL